MTIETRERTPSRLFFALWPDEPLRDQLINWQKEAVVAGKSEPGARLHMTLAFLGDVHEEQRQNLLNMSGEIHAHSLSLILDCLGYFTRPQIVWAGPSQPPVTLFTLHQHVLAVVRACGLEPPKEPFRPHVTLARKAPAPPRKQHCPTLRWDVKEFCLVESVVAESGSRYQILRRFPLHHPTIDDAATTAPR